MTQKDRQEPSLDGSEPLHWQVSRRSQQRIASDGTSGLRFVITPVWRAKEDAQYEIEQSGNGRTILSYLPTLTAAEKECERRACAEGSIYSWVSL